MECYNKVSVVICTKNSESTLKKTLESIKLTKPLEIIIIDGGSTDQTLDIARMFTKRIYYDKGRGLGYARYLGVKLSRGDYVAYIDSDVVIPSPDFFKQLLEEMISNCWIGIHAQIKTLSAKNYWEKGMEFNFQNGFNIPGEKVKLPMMACIIKRDVILDVGFDIHFKGAGEDHDFWKRAYNKAYRFGVSSKVWVFHQHRSSFREFIKQRIWYGKGNILLFSKYHDWKRLFNFIGNMIGGVILSINQKKFKFIPFFVLKELGVGVGELIKIIDHLVLDKEGL